jgi:osmoprotectant transport system ATP-binding protein
VQVGTPSEIIENPADEFVASFIGADRGRRALHLKQTPQGTVVVDSEGRTQGALVAETETSDGPLAGPDAAALDAVHGGGRP